MSIQLEIKNRRSFLLLQIALGLATDQEKAELAAIPNILQGAGGGIAVMPMPCTIEEFIAGGQQGNATSEPISNRRLREEISSDDAEAVKVVNVVGEEYRDGTPAEKLLFGDGYKPRRARVVHGDLSR
jgi:hypothetical protein